MSRTVLNYLMMGLTVSVIGERQEIHRGARQPTEKKIK